MITLEYFFIFRIFFKKKIGLLLTKKMRNILSMLVVLVSVVVVDATVHECYCPKYPGRLLKEGKIIPNPQDFTNLNVSLEKFHLATGEEANYRKSPTVWLNGLPCIFPSIDTFNAFVEDIPELTTVTFRGISSYWGEGPIQKKLQAKGDFDKLKCADKGPFDRPPMYIYPNVVYDFTQATSESFAISSPFSALACIVPKFPFSFRANFTGSDIEDIVELNNLHDQWIREPIPTPILMDTHCFF